MPYRGIQIQLVDTPPILADEMPTGLAGTFRLADVLLIVADLSTDDCLEQLEGTLAHLRRRRILREEGEEPALHPKVLANCLLLGNKCDCSGSADRLAVLTEILPAGIFLYPISAATGAGLIELPVRIFDSLGIIRVYSKIPGKEADQQAPFTLKRGSTVLDMAAAVHRDFPDRLKNARLWGSARFPGQSVPREYVLSDGDVVELHV